MLFLQNEKLVVLYRCRGDKQSAESQATHQSTFFFIEARHSCLAKWFDLFNHRTYKILFFCITCFRLTAPHGCPHISPFRLRDHIEYPSADAICRLFPHQYTSGPDGTNVALALKATMQQQFQSPCVIMAMIVYQPSPFKQTIARRYK